MDKNTEKAEEATDEPVTSEETEAAKSKLATEPSKSDDLASDAPAKLPKKPNRFKRFIATKKGKVIIVIAALILVAAVLLAVPATRYGILGTFVKKNVNVMVMDSSTMKPVSQATVNLGEKTAKTDKKGEATLEGVPVGEYTIQTTKGYYKTNSASYTVPVLGEAKQTHVSLTATGRQVSLSVSNKITGALLVGATVTVKDTSAVTDSKGVATIVLPADKKVFEGKVSLDGYNESVTEIKVTDNAEANKALLTPAGEVYYLSKQSGKINVMKSRLDGTNQSTVVEGTGNENDRETILLAARDWNYMALLAKRSADVKKPGQLYLVDAKTGGLKVIDEGNATFQLVGWSNHKFIYMVSRINSMSWEPKTQRLKSYDAETGKLSILDENESTGTNFYDYQYEDMHAPYITENKLVYTKSWSRSPNVSGPWDKKSAIITINADGTQKQRVKEFTAQRFLSLNTNLYKPQEVYFSVYIDGGEATYYEYEGGSVKSISSSQDAFYNTFYPTYFVSPNGQKTFWYEPRDGKNTLLVGDVNGKEGVTTATRSEYATFGWFSDKYVLVSKNGSELYIAAADKPLDEPLKITNYHKPGINFPGYGYGYGGQ